MYQLGVFGNPIAHSLSPRIFTEFGNETGIPLKYDKICVAIDHFEEEVRRFFANGGYALNITAPFKARAFTLANTHAVATLLSETANILLKTKDGIHADNTDGIGLVADLTRNKVQLQGKNILILGSGSVIFSILASLEKEQPARIDLLMRNMDKLDEFMFKSKLVDEFSNDIIYDLVINTTPNTPDNQLFKQFYKLAPDACAYDMAYTAPETLFMQTLANCQPGIKVINGLGMLIQQARYGFNCMFNIYPPVDQLYPLLNGILHG